MNRRKQELPFKTWIVTGVLACLCLGLLYYGLVDRRVRMGIRAAEEERASLENRLSVMQQQAANVEGVSDEMNALQASGQFSWMPSYNAEELEIDFLNRLLSQDTSTYNLSFSDVERSDNQIRRPFSLSFTANSYTTARTILYRLTHGDYRCLISSVSFSGYASRDSGPAQVSLSGTFYETMAGGEPDMGLAPGDRAAASDPLNVGGVIVGGFQEAVSRYDKYNASLEDTLQNIGG